MSESMEPKAQASSVAWSWRDRAAGFEAARAREAAANRVKGMIGGAIGLAVAALLYFVFHKVRTAEVVAAIAVLVALTALASPLGGYKALTRFLDRFAHAVGAAVTWALMTVLFYLVFLPAGLVLRARGKLAVTHGSDRRLPTYWIATEERERARTPESYKKQF
jgi:VIT1/CCC1 family predicted Fe2+/Mn2+ transporter